jgi:hypothetical protein
VIAIVKQNNIAGLDLAYPAADAGCRLGLPVMSGNGPHDDLGKSDLTSGRVKLRSAKSERRANAAAVSTGGSKHCILTAIQLFNDLPPSEEEQIRMVIGVIPNGVVGGNDLGGQRRTLVHVLTKHEERCRDAMPLQQ